MSGWPLTQWSETDLSLGPENTSAGSDPCEVLLARAGQLNLSSKNPGRALGFRSIQDPFASPSSQCSLRATRATSHSCSFLIPKPRGKEEVVISEAVLLHGAEAGAQPRVPPGLGSSGQFYDNVPSVTFFSFFFF